MTTATAAFFDGLATRGPEPMLGSTRARVRFDLADGDEAAHWLLAIADGMIDVSHDDGPADCIVRAERVSFDALASGATNAMAAVLRGAVEVEGDPRIFVRVQRLFPPPSGMPKAAGARTVGRRRG